ncbi:GrpB family protein [Peribacillus frigoritolerans]|nr:GrpB family protein [Peribacillus frigoritolerans]
MYAGTYYEPSTQDPIVKWSSDEKMMAVIRFYVKLSDYMEKTVKVEEYNPDWVSKFQQEKARIMEVLKNDSLCVEHIGSTSVIGLGG